MDLNHAHLTWNYFFFFFFDISFLVISILIDDKADSELEVLHYFFLYQLEV